MSRKRYRTNCTALSSGEPIRDMVEGARELTWESFRRHIHLPDLRDLFPMYEQGSCLPHIKHDYHVRYYRGRFQGRECVFLVHSAIEYIFV